MLPKWASGRDDVGIVGRVKKLPKAWKPRLIGWPFQRSEACDLRGFVFSEGPLSLTGLCADRFGAENPRRPVRNDGQTSLLRNGEYIFLQVAGRRNHGCDPMVNPAA